MTIITAALGILSLLVMIGITSFIVRYIRMANQMRINGTEIYCNKIRTFTSKHDSSVGEGRS